MTRLIFLALISLCSITTHAQHQAIGAWREHLPYNRGKMVADAGSKVYCATEDGLFAYVKEDGNLERYTRLTGLHDFGISSIAFDKNKEVLIIGYTNANIDLIYSDGRIFNIPFIKEKNITGSKSINSIYSKDGLEYLACGFGIVVLDPARQEIKDSYFIGPGGSSLNILDISSDGNYIYAASDSGVYSAPVTTNLADYNNWSRILDDANNAGDYNKIIFFGGKIYVNYAQPDAQFSNTDDLYINNGGVWSLFQIPELPSQPKRYSLRVINDELVVANENSVSVFNSSWQLVTRIDNTIYTDPQIRDGWKEGNGVIWIADKRRGLVRVANSIASIITPSGPSSAYTGDIQIENNVLWVVHGPKSISWSPQEYPIDGFSCYKDGTWSSY
ncbi:MAG: hypothetical protein ABI772_14590, partial [Bacteroidota bacterium]